MNVHNVFYSSFELEQVQFIYNIRPIKFLVCVLLINVIKVLYMNLFFLSSFERHYDQP